MKKISFGNRSKNGKKRGKKGKKLLLLLLILLAVILGLYAAVRIERRRRRPGANTKEGVKTAVEKRDITSELSSSGTISRRIHTISPLSWKARYYPPILKRGTR